MERKTLLAYCLSKPGAYEDTPFGPDTLVLKVMNKMFGALGIDPNTSTINLKCDPDHALILRQNYPDDVKPGWHMNKKHWNTVTFNGHVPDDLIFEWVDESYELVVASLKKAEREQLRKIGDNPTRD
jgi:predicted DNA-binding protein (MmcQ/YjbR family)